MPRPSPFLDPGSHASPDSLAIVHLSRENLVPVYLKDGAGRVDGYAEGAVINTRYGSFPHSTLLHRPWGSQIRASVVDTGSRGRKRKTDINDSAEENEEEASGAAKGAVTAASGFAHILPPSPELWTSSLPHRTQVVYTPDYSYILHRIRARPGMKMIEAGAGSGSFTHAAARAVYSGYPICSDDSKGMVFSFEFNKERHEKMVAEIEGHGLNSIVRVTHQDVYNDGFLIDGQSPEAECVFLDLPAPWRALPHLSRSQPGLPGISNGTTTGTATPSDGSGSAWISPLRRDRSVYLCTFSPCIEQVTRTVETMRRLGWVEIEMVEVSNKRMTIMRERTGLNMPIERGANQTPSDVAEAVARLKVVEGRFKEFHGKSQNDGFDAEERDPAEIGHQKSHEINGKSANPTKPESAPSTKPWSLGRLIHRTEPELRTHTSYLVFAILPQEWSEEQEADAFERWPCGKEEKVIGSLDKETRKQEKRELLKGKRKRKLEEAAEEPAKKKVNI